jgi:quinoprotein glucose dehydrogenase
MLLSRLTNDQAAEVRVEALKVLAIQNSGKLNEAVKKAFQDKNMQVRTTGLSLLSKTNLSADEKASLLRDIIYNKTVQEKQAAINALADLADAQKFSVLDELMAQAEKSKLPVEVNIEFEEALKNSKSTALTERYEKLRRSAPDTLLFSYQGTLQGGDPERGKGVFWGNENAQCLRCHSFDDFGGNAGPRLNGIGARLTRTQLLEALITPSKKIAEGFGTVTLELKNGNKLSGKLQSENDQAFVIKSGQKADTTILKADIVKSTLAGSSMPPMYLLLSKKEIRDLISFLETLKTEN